GAPLLKLTNLFHVRDGHFLDPPAWRLFSVETLCLKAVQRLVGAEGTSQSSVVQPGASDGVEAENRGARAHRRHRHTGGAPGRPALLPEESRQLADGGRVEDDRERKLAVESLFDLRQQPHCKERMAAELEEIVLRADPIHVENLLPQPRKLHLYDVLR